MLKWIKIKVSVIKVLRSEELMSGETELRDGISYSYQAANNPIHIFQTSGGSAAHYSEQHDSIFVASIKKSARNKKSLKSLFNSTAHHLENTLDKRVFENNGSTATLALAQGGKLTVSHVGDSPAFLLFRDGLSGSIRSVRLNSDHNGLNPSEKARVESLGGIILKKKYIFEPPYALAVTRAFGDGFFKGMVSHEPEIKHHSVKRMKKKNEEVYLCIASDGLTDGLIVPSPSLEQLFNKHALKELPEAMAAFAAENGSKDNITVSLTKIDVSDKTPYAIGVFDGHGNNGKKVSSAASQYFYKNLSKL
jgi:serine/threonine protein phosphatase PrpC